MIEFRAKLAISLWLKIMALFHSNSTCGIRALLKSSLSIFLSSVIVFLNKEVDLETIKSSGLCTTGSGLTTFFKPESTDLPHLLVGFSALSYSDVYVIQLFIHCAIRPKMLSQGYLFLVCIVVVLLSLVKCHPKPSSCSQFHIAKAAVSSCSSDFQFKSKRSDRRGGIFTYDAAMDGMHDQCTLCPNIFLTLY